jgi:hypothetical protein
MAIYWGLICGIFSANLTEAGSTGLLFGVYAVCEVLWRMRYLLFRSEHHIMSNNAYDPAVGQALLHVRQAFRDWTFYLYLGLRHGAFACLTSVVVWGIKHLAV